jgi:hypothetical protein
MTMASSPSNLPPLPLPLSVSLAAGEAKAKELAAHAQSAADTARALSELLASAAAEHAALLHSLTSAIDRLGPRRRLDLSPAAPSEQAAAIAFDIARLVGRLDALADQLDDLHDAAAIIARAQAGDGAEAADTAAGMAGNEAGDADAAEAEDEAET